MKRTSPHVLAAMTFAASLLACGSEHGSVAGGASGAGTGETSSSGGDAGVEAQPYDGPCGGKTCEEGTAGLAFDNSTASIRRVYVDGKQVCRLAPGERCQTAITAAVNVIIHVTGDAGEDTCSDPNGTFGACVCATFTIRC